MTAVSQVLCRAAVGSTQSGGQAVFSLCLVIVALALSPQGWAAGYGCEAVPTPLCSAVVEAGAAARRGRGRVARLGGWRHGPGRHLCRHPAQHPVSAWRYLPQTPASEAPTLARGRGATPAARQACRGWRQRRHVGPSLGDFRRGAIQLKSTSNCWSGQGVRWVWHAL